jgi:hypothetical protein
MFKNYNASDICYATTCIKFKVHQVFNIEVPMLQKKYRSYYRPEYSTFISD